MPSRVPSRIERWFAVRPDEERDAFASFSVLFGVMAGHTMLETARDSLFLTRLPASQLPFVYLGSAVAGISLTLLDRKLARRASSTSAIGIYMVAGALATSAFVLADLTSPPALYGLYLWSTVFASWAVLQFSLLTSARFDVGQAKRVLGFVGAGAIFGSFFGASVARAVVEFLPVRTLLGGAAVVFVLTAMGPLRFLGKNTPVAQEASVTPLTKEAMRGASAIAHDSYARLLLLLLVASTIALMVGDFAFKTYARKHYSEDLASFFATIQIAVNAIALLVQLLLVPRVLRTVGAHGALLLLPALLAVGGLGMLFQAGLVGALLLRGADGSLRFSLHKTAFDLLYFPLSESERRRIKPVLEVLGQRGGQALAAVCLIALDRAPRSYPIFVLFGALIVWMTTVGFLRAPYVRLFRESLRRGDLSLARDMRLDLHGLESAVAALSSTNEGEVRLAIDLLAAHRNGTLVPTVMMLHPSVKVVLHTIEVFAAVQRTDAAPAIERMLSHFDPEVRAAALRALAQLAPDETMLRELLDDSRSEVAATALVALAAHGWITSEHVDEALARLGRSEAAEVRLAVARAAVVQPSAALVSVLRTCIKGGDPRVIEATTQAMALVPDESYIPLLLPLLERSRHREDARRALTALGRPALNELARLLRDRQAPHLLRRHLPESIRRFPAADALPILVEQLGRERDGMVRFKVLRSLNRLRVRDPKLRIPEALIVGELEKTLASAFRYRHLRSVLLAGDENGARPHTPAAELLVDVLHDKRVHATERCMRLVNLLLPAEDFRPLMRGYTSGTGRLRASALEVIGATLPARYRAALLGLLDDDGDPEGPGSLAAAGEFYTPEPLGYREALKRLTSLSGTTLRAIAAYHAAEVGVETAAMVSAGEAERPSVLLLEELVRLRSMVGAKT